MPPEDSKLLRVVGDCLLSLLESSDFAETSRAFLTRLASGLGASEIRFFEAASDAGSFRLVAGTNVGEGAPSASWFASILSSLSADTPVVLLSEAPEVAALGFPASAGSLAIVPVGSPTEPLGLLAAAKNLAGVAWHEAELSALRAAAAGLANALLRHRLGDSILVRSAELTKSRRVALSLMEDAQRSAAKAEQASRAKSAFLAMMSHEIRTPLNGVIGFTDLLLAEKLPPAHEEIVATIRGCGNSLLGLISDILDLSKVEAGRMDLEMVACSLQECVNDVLAALQPARRVKNLEFSSHIDPSVPPLVVTDPKRLRQILFNLFGNAIKFTEKGGVSFRMWASPGEEGRLKVTCEITDSGIGIPESEQAGIFEAFEQGDSVHRKFGGIGLGLAVCRKLVDAMGGEISVRSRTGEGTSVTFSVSVLTPETQTHSMVPAADPAPLPDLSHLRILAVDDVAINRRLMEGILQKMGCQLSLAADGREAVTLVENQAFDIIFMDVLMPVCDGIEATRLIRNMEASTTGRTPTWIIALTADAFSENRMRCLDAGMNEFLTKPIRMEAIRDAMERAIRALGKQLRP